MLKSENWLCVPQPRLGVIGMILLICMSCCAVPFSLDTYTPALPSIGAELNTTAEMVNYTMLGFFFVNTVMILIAGPVSDKIGRKPVLVGSSVIYIIGSACCYIAPTIEMLIGARILQAIGSGPFFTTCLATIKDAFIPEKRKLVLSVNTVIAVMGPLLAPVIGSVVVTFFPWRVVFLVMVVIGCLMLLLSMLFAESLSDDERTNVGVIQSLGGLVKVIKCKGFSWYLFATSFIELPFMAYVSVAAYIYITGFGCTEIEYGLFFGVATCFSALGPVVYFTLSRKFSDKTITTIFLIAQLVVGVYIVTAGRMSPWLFAVSIAAMSVIAATMRPFSTAILLSQFEGDTGSASAAINFTKSLMGSFGMALVVLPWPSYLDGVGILLMLAGLVGLAAYLVILKRPIKVEGIN